MVLDIFALGVVHPATLDTMRQRTDWGDLLEQ